MINIDLKFEEILINEYVDVEKTITKLNELEKDLKNVRPEYKLFRESLLANCYNETAKAIEIAEEAFNKASFNNNSFLIEKISIHLGFMFCNRMNYERSIDYYLVALQYNNHPRVINNIGVIFTILGDLKEGYKYFSMAAKKIDVNHNNRLKSIIYNNLAECECEFGNYDKAKQLLTIAYDIMMSSDNPIGTAYLYNSYGLIEMRKGNYKKAIYYFNIGVSNYDVEKSTLHYSDLLRNYANVLYKIEDFSGILEKLDLIEKLRIEYNLGEKNCEDLHLRAKVKEHYKDYIEANKIYCEYIDLIKNNEHRNVKTRVENLKNKVKLLEITKKVNALERISQTDSLTGIKNRYSLTEYFKRLFTTDKTEHVTSVVLVDVDYFKEFNDYYGHSCGDECLKKVVNQLSLVLDKDENQLFRYGGDEFFAILPDVSTEEALDLVNATRAKIAELRINNKNSRASNYITCSFGITTIKDISRMNFKEILGLVDKALYKAKNRGRNEICFIYTD